MLLMQPLCSMSQSFGLGQPGQTVSEPTLFTAGSNSNAQASPGLVLSSPLAIGGTDSPPTRKAPGTVLVVDDMALNRLVLGHMVRKAGLEVVEASNGAECLAQVRNHPPGKFQCILMDLQMPIMDGWEAAQQVRAWEASSSQLNQSPLINADLTPNSIPATSPGPAVADIPGLSFGLNNPQPFLMPSDIPAANTAAFLLQDKDPYAEDAFIPQHLVGSCSSPAPAAILANPNAQDTQAAPPGIALFWPAAELSEIAALTTACASLSTTGQQQQPPQQQQQAGSQDGPHSGTPVQQARIPIVACTAEVLGAPSQARLLPGASSQPGSAPVTAHSHALFCGMDDCVKKPLSFSELCTILDRYIPERQPRTSAKALYQRAVTCDVLGGDREELMAPVEVDDSKAAYNRSFSASSDRLACVGEVFVSHPLWRRSTASGSQPIPSRAQQQHHALRRLHTDEGLLASEEEGEEDASTQEVGQTRGRLEPSFPVSDTLDQPGLLDCITEEHILDMSCACLFDSNTGLPRGSRSGRLSDERSVASLAAACADAAALPAEVCDDADDDDDVQDATVASWLLGTS